MILNAPPWLAERAIAHRGLHDREAGLIENTLGAAEAAIAAGFAIECDVQISADGEAMVFHDATLDRLCTASGALETKTAAEIQAAALRGTRERIATFSQLLALVSGRTPIVCELKSAFNGDPRIADRLAALACDYAGPLALKSFDPDLIAHLRERWPRLGPSGVPCPLGIVAEANYDDPYWAGLTVGQKRVCANFLHLPRTRPDFLSWNVDNLPHPTPFLLRELCAMPILAWTVKTPAQRAIAGSWADQVVFEGAGRP